MTLNTSNKELEDALAGVAALGGDRQPQRDLWIGIESRIQSRRARAWRTPLWAGAGMAATLTLVLGLSIHHQDRESLHGRPLQAPAALAVGHSGETRDPALVDVVDHPLHPESRALVRANIKIVNNAEAELRRALAADPNGEYLKSLLASARSQQTELAALEDRR